MKKILLFFCAFLFAATAYGQSPQTEQAQNKATFRFLPDDDMFYLSVHENEAELSRLLDFIRKYRAEIDSSQAPVFVTSYSAALETVRDNLNSAKIRANRVKTELINRAGLKESDFVTKNLSQRYEGQSSTVLVQITVSVPATVQTESKTIVEISPQRPGRQEGEAKPKIEEKPQPVIDEPVMRISDSYCFAIRTNLLHWLALTPNLGVEWRINEYTGIGVDAGYSGWEWKGGDRVHKVWYVKPEIRWYLLAKKRFYVGASGAFGEYNLKLGDKTGYQGDLFSAGVVVGYQLRMSDKFSMDFNLGIGYTQLKYDSFSTLDGERRYKVKDIKKDIFAPTQAGVSLLWKLGK